MTQFIQFFLLAAVPLYIFRRALSGGGECIFNFTLYPLIFSYFYLLVPSLITTATTVGEALSLSYTSSGVIDLLGFWSVSVFWLSYILSDDPSIRFNERLRLAPITVTAARVVQSLTFVVMLFVLAKHGPSLYALAGERAGSYNYYAQEIIDVYKLPVLFAFTIISCSLLYLRYRNLRQLAPIFTFIALDALHGGRGYTFAALIVLCANYLALNMNQFKRVASFMIVIGAVVFASAFVRRYIAADDTGDPLVVFFGEFLFTRMTAQFAYDYAISQGDLITYFLVSLSKLLPQFMVAPLFTETELIPYHVVLNRNTGIDFGLAGSLMSEALYYGGMEFAIISPAIISGIFLLLNRSRVVRGIPGYLFFLVLSSSMYLFFRTGFYPNFFSLCYMFIFYFSLMIVPSAHKRVFLRLTSQ